mmetsp:Transcript_60158/g.141979  ORF Transcript_60158/g.141979 Transcript_60158/m.141979 type:complete len:357 (-) Transcript_60158:38-1108(-)
MSSASSSLSLARLMASFETRRSESSARYLNPSTWLRLKGRGCTTAWPFSACFATRPASLAASSGATRERAVPLLPPRAVRPHRCVYARSVCGRSKLTTVSTFLKSSPRITPYSLSRVPSAAFDIFFKSLILAFAIPRAPAPERRSFWRCALSSSSAIPFPPFFPAFAFASFSSSSSSSSRISAHIDLGDAAEEFPSFVSGEYDIQILIGDALLTAPVLWSVAHATISLPRSSSPSQRPDEILQALPASLPPQALAAEPDALAYVFTGLVVLATLGCFVSVLSCQPNLSAMSKSGGGTVTALAFQAAAVGYYALVALFWLNLSLPYLLAALFVGLPAMLGLGWYATSGRTPAPLKQS